MLTYTLTICIYIFLVCIWAMMGFFVWVPLLFRTSMIFSVALLRNTLVGHSMENVERALEYSKIFYIKGFQQIHKSIFWGTRYENPVFAEVPALGIMVREISIALTFWLITTYFFGLWNFYSIRIMFDNYL